ncbi:MAG: isopentenyl-diphosphate Delta-isomerase, partial [Ilumatobacteraceae bacterium]
RAAVKLTWPSVWTNGCCGHPAVDETLRHAVARRLDHELDLTPRQLAMMLDDFSYRAVMDNGVAENELCPVMAAMVDRDPTPNPAEVDDYRWVSWDDLRRRAAERPETLSPWAVAQIGQLAGRGSPLTWFGGAGPSGRRRSAIGLDVPIRATSRALPWTTPGPLEPVRAPVDRLLAEHLAACEAEVSDLEPMATQVAGRIRELVLAGGKRLRPAFVYWGHRAGGADHDDGVLTAAAALELLHTFALIHDDVMDHSDWRRGQPSLHRALARQHADDGLVGDHDWFGLSAAVLAGDLAAVWADRLFESTPMAADAVARARTVYAQLRIEVMVGQFMDLRLAGSPTGDEAGARRVALLKSGRYTVTRPLQLGARLAGAPDHVVDLLGRFGDEIGVAFQLRDDLLGVFGSPHETGKSAVDDLREGKRTVLVIKALESATGPSRRFLETSLGAPDLADGDAARCRDIIEESGARRAVARMIDRHHARALRALASLDAGPARCALEDLAVSACERER